MIENTKDRSQDLASLDLSNPETLRQCLLNWNGLATLAEEYPKLADLKSDLDMRIKRAPLTDKHRRAIFYNLIWNKTQKDTGKLMGIGVRRAADLVEESLRILADYEARRED